MEKSREKTTPFAILVFLFCRLRKYRWRRTWGSKFSRLTISAPSEQQIFDQQIRHNQKHRAHEDWNTWALCQTDKGLWRWQYIPWTYDLWTGHHCTRSPIWTESNRNRSMQSWAMFWRFLLRPAAEFCRAGCRRRSCQRFKSDPNKKASMCTITLLVCNYSDIVELIAFFRMKITLSCGASSTPASTSNQNVSPSSFEAAQCKGVHLNYKTKEWRKYSKFTDSWIIH